MATSPLLEELFGRGGGHILYKGYQHHRADDAQALLDLAAALGDRVRFLPIPQMIPERQDVIATLGEIYAALSPLDRAAAREWNLINDAVIARGKDGASLPDYLRERIYIPEAGPVLVVGYPASLLGFKGWPNDTQPSDVRRLMDDAGFPNRFWLELAPPGRDQPPQLCDRKTLCHHLVRDYKASEFGLKPVANDVGLLYFRRTSSGRPVLVAAGSTEFGTYAAVRLLLQGHHALDRVVAQLARDPSKAIDVGFRCYYRKLDSEDRPFPHAHPVDVLHTEVIDEDNLVGYSWGRSAAEVLRPLIPGPASAEQNLLGDSQLVWQSDPREHRHLADGQELVPVSITARAVYRVADGQLVFASDRLKGVYDQAYDDLRQDRLQWPVLSGISSVFAINDHF